MTPNQRVVIDPKWYHHKGACECKNKVWTWNVTRGFIYLTCTKCRHVCKYKLDIPPTELVENVKKFDDDEEDDWDGL